MKTLHAVMKRAAPVVAACALIALAGCDGYEMLELFPSTASGTSYDVTGHWAGHTGDGQTFTMDLAVDNGDHTLVTGTMTRNGVTGNFSGSIDMEASRLSFTVTWPHARITTGDANIYNPDRMKDGTLRESGATTSFGARKE